MRLALLSNVTVELLAGMLKKEHSLWVPSGFGAWIQTALAPPDNLREFDPEFIFLLLDKSHAEVDSGRACQAQERLRTLFPQAAVVEIDLADLADETGCDRFYDEKMWKLASMPWSLVGLHAIADEVNRLVAMARTGRKKVLALDFDNTLWSGVIGEDGVTGIVPDVEFQREIKRLQETGVLLVALTKNNVADVEPIWSDSRMALKKDDFVALRIDWNDKCANLRKVASELNLGTDSFVFVDDCHGDNIPADLVALSRGYRSGVPRRQREPSGIHAPYRPPLFPCASFDGGRPTEDGAIPGRVCTADLCHGAFRGRLSEGFGTVGGCS